MISIPRGLCRAFPALTRKCVSGRPRGPATLVVIEAKGGSLTVRTDTGDAAPQRSASLRSATKMLQACAPPVSARVGAR